MYGKMFSTVFFSMMPLYNVNLMYSKDEELKKVFVFAESHFFMH